MTGPASPLPAGWEPASTTVEVLINGQQVDHAVGSEETGHPLGAVAWLAKKLAEFGRRIEPGHRIMSGSFTKQYPLAQGDRSRPDSPHSGASRRRSASVLSDCPASGRTPPLAPCQ